jgi:hypothetical protein
MVKVMTKQPEILKGFRKVAEVPEGYSCKNSRFFRGKLIIISESKPPIYLDNKTNEWERLGVVEPIQGLNGGRVIIDDPLNKRSD